MCCTDLVDVLQESGICHAASTKELGHAISDELCCWHESGQPREASESRCVRTYTHVSVKERRPRHAHVQGAARQKFEYVVMARGRGSDMAWVRATVRVGSWTIGCGYAHSCG